MYIAGTHAFATVTYAVTALNYERNVLIKNTLAYWVFGGLLQAQLTN
jgi:hypothetical protein